MEGICHREKCIVENILFHYWKSLCYLHNISVGVLTSPVHLVQFGEALHPQHYLNWAARRVDLLSACLKLIVNPMSVLGWSVEALKRTEVELPLM